MTTPDSTQDLEHLDPVEGDRPTLTLAHFSDTHLGFKQYPTTSGSGRNQREVDFSLAFLRVVEDIAEADPALIIHAGDLYDNSRPAFRHVMQGQQGLAKLAQNGRLVVIAAGNHDMPADAQEASPVDLHKNAPGVYLSSRKYQVIDCSELVAQGQARPELDKVAIHLLPHDTLKSISWDEVQPWEGYLNILVSHCVVGGSELYRRAIGREYALPIDVLTRGWHYVALGHYHKQGPVAVGGFSEATTPAWYSGSTENNGFSDVRDNKTGGGRGWLKVHLAPHSKIPQVEPVDLAIRSMFRLPPINASDLGHAEITEKMLANINDAVLEGAVVRQVITNLDPDTWGLVDVASVRAAAKDALWYEPKPEFKSLEVAVSDLDPDAAANPLGDLSTVLSDLLSELYGSDPLSAQIEAQARMLLGDALGVPEPADCCHTDDDGHEGHTHEDEAVAGSQVSASAEEPEASELAS